MPAYKAVVFDRDSTLNVTTQILRAGQKPGDATDGYVLSPDEMQLFPSVVPALTALRAQGVRLFVFTQQNCIGKGLITAEQVEGIHHYMNGLLGPAAAIEKFYYAWNKPGQGEDPRAKPSPAMLLEIMQDHGFTAADVLVVGDSKRDYKAAVAAGMDFVWIRDDLRRLPEEEMRQTGCPVFDDVGEMVHSIFLS